MGGRALPHYCEHGVPVDGGDFVDSVECKDCELARFREGYKGACYACETVGEKNVGLEAHLAAAERDAERLRGHLQNCVNHLEGSVRRFPSLEGRFQKPISAANTALRETLHTDAARDNHPGSADSTEVGG